eukprot:5186194-Alexandrium_andersonii.AAC.1
MCIRDSRLPLEASRVHPRVHACTDERIRGQRPECKTRERVSFSHTCSVDPFSAFSRVSCSRTCVAAAGVERLPELLGEGHPRTAWEDPWLP